MSSFKALFHIPELLILKVVQKFEPVPYVKFQTTCKLAESFVQKYVQQLRNRIHKILYLSFISTKQTQSRYNVNNNKTKKKKKKKLFAPNAPVRGALKASRHADYECNNSERIPEYPIEDVLQQTKGFHFTDIQINMNNFEPASETHRSVFDEFLRKYTSSDRIRYEFIRSYKQLLVATSYTKNTTILNFYSATRFKGEILDDELLRRIASQGTKNLKAVCYKYSGHIQETWNLFDTVEIFGHQFVNVPTLENQLLQFVKDLSSCSSVEYNKKMAFGKLPSNPMVHDACTYPLMEFLSKTELNYVQVFDMYRHKPRYRLYTDGAAGRSIALIIAKNFWICITFFFNWKLIIPLRKGDLESFILCLDYQFMTESDRHGSPMDWSCLYEELEGIPLTDYLEIIHNRWHSFWNYPELTSRHI